VTGRRELALLTAAAAAAVFPLFVPTLAPQASVLAASTSQTPYCRMAPAHRAIRIPARRLTWLAGEEDSGACDGVGAGDWSRTPSRPADLWVHADGPSGSGRHWTVTVGTGPKAGAVPTGGVCLSTSTVGWRTLRRFGQGPLPWTGDADRDGRGEVVVWSSFPLSNEPSAAEFGLVAWVYEMQSASLLSLDVAQSRRLARQVAAAYRDTAGVDADLAPLRRRAAESLDAFARGTCRVRPAPSR